MELTEEQIFKAINLLDIPTNNQRNGNWLGILCPYHKDTNFGNCSINLKSGAISCFSCHEKGSVIDLIKQRFNVNFKEAMNLIDNSFYSVTIPKMESKKKKDYKSSNGEHYFTEVDFDPENYFYTKQRGFNKEFNQKFNVTRCLSGFYNDFMIIPCIDTKLNINEFECRKLFEYENLCIFFNVINGNFKKLKKKFEKYCDRNKIVLKKGSLYKDDEVFYDEKIYYLLKPKVLYPLDSQLYRTIWNIDNLDFNKELWLAEGMGSIPKIWTYITKNCSHPFGSKISPEQIEILKKFEKIVLIPDPDEAGYSMVKDMNRELDNFVVKSIKLEDTSKSYVDDLLSTKELKPNEYLSRHILRKGLF
jgi:5S rRNA maturation endonuclease (ribonuclease M5)